MLHPSDIPEPYRAFATALMDHPDAPVELLRLFLTLGDRADGNARSAFVDMLAETWPDEPIIRAAVSHHRTKRVPAYHRRMVLDAKRNGAYAAAIAASIRPGMRVLEIGAGTGILAMLAARAGAERVFAIEGNSLMARIARANIERNGLADRVELIEGMSTDDAVRRRVPADCDAVVHEIFDSWLLGEGVLGYVADAREKFLRPGAILLPERAMLLGQIEATDYRDPAGRFGDICGLDLSEIDSIRKVSRLLSDYELPSRRPLSAPVTIAEFDLRESNDRTRTRREFHVTISDDGTAHGLLQWIGFRFPDGTEFANPPEEQGSSWWRLFHEFVTPLTVKAGERRQLSFDQLGSFLAFRLA